MNEWMSRVLAIPPAYTEKIEEDLASISRQLKKRREELGLSQEKLADLLNCEVTTVQAYEQRRKRPSLTTFLLICRVLKIRLIMK